MSHELEIIDGRAVAMGREDAWHHLNVVVGEEFGLDEIRRDAPEILMPVAAVAVEDVDPFHDWRAFDGSSVVIREDGKVVGFNGSRYEIVQAEEAFNLGTQTGLDCISAVSLREGRQHAFTFDLGGYTVGDESMRDYLSVLNSFDGSWSLIGLKSTTIVVCANTADFALNGASVRYNIRHTATWETKVEDVRKALGLAVKSRDLFTTTVERYMLKPFDATQFDLMLDTIVPLDDMQEGRGKTLRINTRNNLRTMFNEGRVSEQYRNTVWGAIQAVNTYAQWSAPLRGVKGKNSQTVRATRRIDELASGKGDALTRQAVKYVDALISA